MKRKSFAKAGRRWAALLLSLALSLSLAGQALANPTPGPGGTTLYVDARNETGTETGSAVSPYSTIQAAVNAADDGDVILVAEGVYEENVVISDDIYLAGGYPGGTTGGYDTGTPGDFSAQDTDSYVSEIRGDGTTYTVYLNESSATVDGFTITNGTRGVYAYGGAPTIVNNIITDNGSGSTSPSNMGAGIRTSASDAHIVGNWIHHNEAGRGAGVAVSGGYVVLEYNEISYNDGYSDHGGGVFFGTNGEITGNLIHHNRIGINLGYGWGGGLIVLGAGNEIALSYNQVYENEAPAGAGTFIDEGATATLDHELIYRNHAVTYAGGLLVDGSGTETNPGATSVAIVRNSTIVYNDRTATSSPYIERGNGLQAYTLSTVTVENSIFWGNGNDIGANTGAVGSTVTVSYTNTENSLSGIPNVTAGLGNTTLDPLFVDADNDNYQLQSEAGHYDFATASWVTDDDTSPLIDAGNPASSYTTEPSPNGNRINMGAFGGTAYASKSTGNAPPDTQAPTVPTDLTATAVSHNQIDLSWTASTDDNAVAGYQIYRNGSLIDTTASTSYSDTGLSASTLYTYTVRAYDAATNLSGHSSSASDTTHALPPDTQAPTVPTGLTATAVSAYQINLSWTASTDNYAVAGYEIYRDGNLIDTTTSTSYSDTGLTHSTLYTYTVRAYDAASNVSGHSSSAAATTFTLGGGGSLPIYLYEDETSVAFTNASSGGSLAQVLTGGGVGGSNALEFYNLDSWDRTRQVDFSASPIDITAVTSSDNLELSVDLGSTSTGGTFRIYFNDFSWNGAPYLTFTVDSTAGFQTHYLSLASIRSALGTHITSFYIERVSDAWPSGSNSLILDEIRFN